MDPLETTRYLAIYIVFIILTLSNTYAACKSARAWFSAKKVAAKIIGYRFSKISPFMTSISETSGFWPIAEYEENGQIHRVTLKGMDRLKPENTLVHIRTKDEQLIKMLWAIETSAAAWGYVVLYIIFAIEITELRWLLYSAIFAWIIPILFLIGVAGYILHFFNETRSFYDQKTMWKNFISFFKYKKMKREDPPYKIDEEKERELENADLVTYEDVTAYSYRKSRTLKPYLYIAIQVMIGVFLVYALTSVFS